MPSHFNYLRRNREHYDISELVLFLILTVYHRLKLTLLTNANSSIILLDSFQMRLSPKEKIHIKCYTHTAFTVSRFVLPRQDLSNTNKKHAIVLNQYVI